MFKNVKTLVMLSLLLALEIVLRRVFAINLPCSTYNLNFVAVAIAAYMYGPLGGVLVSGLGDIVGASLFSNGFAFCWGFTLSAALIGLTFGVLLYHKYYDVYKMVLSVLISRIVFSQFLNTYWLVLYFSKKTFWQLFVFRSIQTIIYIILEPIIIYLCIRVFKKIVPKFVSNNGPVLKSS